MNRSASSKHPLKKLCFFISCAFVTYPLLAHAAEAPVAETDSGDLLMAENTATDAAPAKSKSKAKAAAQPAWAREHAEAVRMARHNKEAEAAAILDRLHNEHPKDAGVTRDYLVVSNWLGHDSEVVSLYESLSGKQPDYVLEAAGRSYRSLGQADKALALYQTALKSAPGNLTLLSGKIRSMADAAPNTDTALTEAQKAIHTSGEKLELLLAAAYAAQSANKGVEGLRYCNRAVQLYPNSRIAKHDLIEATAFMGAPQVALKMADASPGVMTPSEYRGLQSDKAAASVRWSTLEPVDENERFLGTDKAIATLDNNIAQWSKKNDSSADVMRARFDRLVAYRDRYRMQDVIDEYTDMKAHNVEVPPYALTAVGDAYLYLHEPEEAEELYMAVLHATPNDFNTRLQLFYTYVELDDYDAAYEQIDKLDADQNIWIYLKGFPEPLPNPQREAADLAAAYGRLYPQDIDEADDRITKMAHAAPNNPRYRALLGNLYEAHGWDRRALEQYEIGTNLAHGKDVANETGIGNTELGLQHYEAAEQKDISLMNRFPENQEVQKFDRAYQAYDMAELRIDAGINFRGSTAAVGGNGYGIETMLYSPPIDYNWRVFAGEFFAHEREPVGEGNVSYARSILGVEYRNAGITVRAAPTYNHFRDAEQLGARGDFAWEANDQWTFGTYGEVFSRDTPLRALRGGVTANNFNANAAWHQSESRSVRADFNVMPFSDGNFRTNLAVTGRQRIYTDPYFKIDAMLDAAESQNTLNQNVPYFNPERDLLGEVGVDIQHTLYRRYEFEYDHNLQITPGAYWERNFGTTPAWTIMYEQRIRSYETFEAAVGVAYTRQSYDGVRDNTISIQGNIVYRF